MCSKFTMKRMARVMECYLHIGLVGEAIGVWGAKNGKGIPSIDAFGWRSIIEVRSASLIAATELGSYLGNDVAALLGIFSFTSA